MKFVQPFEVFGDDTTVLLFDSIAEESVVFTGGGKNNEPKVIFKPVIKLSIEQGGKTNEIVSVEGTISAVDTEAETISIIPDGETEAIVLNVTPQIEIT